MAKTAKKAAKKAAAKKAAAKRAKNLHPALLAAGGAALSAAAAKAAKWAMKPFSSASGAKSAKPAKKKSKKRATKKHSPPVGGRAAKLKKAVTLKAKTARPPARTGPPAVVAEVASALRGLGYSAGKARSMALLGQEATGSKHFDAVLHSAMKGAKKNPIIMTRALARAASQDAAERQMRKAGRSKWSQADSNLYARTYKKLWPLKYDILGGKHYRNNPGTGSAKKTPTGHGKLKQSAAM